VAYSYSQEATASVVPAEPGGGAVVANRTQASDWETFKVRPSPTTLPLEFQLRCVVSDRFRIS
jgi:hypothetical protein